MVNIPLTSTARRRQDKATHRLNKVTIKITSSRDIRPTRHNSNRATVSKTSTANSPTVHLRKADSNTAKLKRPFLIATHINNSKANTVNHNIQAQLLHNSFRSKAPINRTSIHTTRKHHMDNLASISMAPPTPTRKLKATEA